MNAGIWETDVDTEQTATKAGDDDPNPNKGDTERVRDYMVCVWYGRAENPWTMRIKECVDDTTTHLTGHEEEEMYD